MDSYSPQARSTDPEHRRRARLLVLVTLVFGLLALWTIRPHAVRAAVDRMESMIGHKSDAPRTAAPGLQTAKPNSGV